MKGLLVDDVDRHLRRSKDARIMSVPTFADHGRQARPAGQDMRAALGTKLPSHGAIEIGARKLLWRPFGVTEAFGRHQQKHVGEPPLIYWHSRQWRCALNVGSPSAT